MAEQGVSTENRPLLVDFKLDWEKAVLANCKDPNELTEELTTDIIVRLALWMPLGLFCANVHNDMTGEQWYNRMKTEGYQLFIDDVRMPQEKLTGEQRKLPTVMARSSRQAIVLIELLGCPRHIFMDYWLETNPHDEEDNILKFIDRFAHLIADDDNFFRQGMTYSTHSADNVKGAKSVEYMKTMIEAFV